MSLELKSKSIINPETAALSALNNINSVLYLRHNVEKKVDHTLKAKMKL